MRKMPRKWARISVALMAAGIFLACLGVMIKSYAPIIPGFVLLGAAVGIKLSKLRCPYCTAFTTTPQWFGSGNKRCRKCKQFIEYDY